MRRFLHRSMGMVWVIGLCFFSQAAWAETQVHYLAHLNANTQKTATGAMAIAFKQRLQHLTEDQIRVEVFPKGQLGSQTQIVDLVKKGVIQSAIVSVGGLSKAYPFIGILNFPFRFRDLQETYDVFDGPFGRYMGADIEKKMGVSVLGYGDTGGLFVFTNHQREIRTPQDMQGLRFRTMRLSSHQTLIKSLGGTPLTIGWRELYTALSNGTVDGQMNPAGIVQMGKFNEVQTHLTVSNHLYTPYIWIANPAYLAQLSPTHRAALAQAAKVGVKASRKLAASANSMEVLAKTMQIHYPTDAALQQFKAATQPAMTRYIEQTLKEEGMALLREFQASH
ncbi:DctP family TRAP transporter solute-binding subunit [Magnetococcus sp. PR-3]|uniref:DctP family TRAP transporter solute-binding subunit n=1 Tax=Magnetococcus sp. PR-3 TaxID=3120355 RepID=UPI002FCE011D